MKIIDISQEITNCKVYPGDPKPEVKKINDMENNDLYNLSTINMCAHNGTHVDAPSHFIKDGKNIDEIDLSYFVGECFICTYNGNIYKNEAYEILEKANKIERILIKGNCVITEEAALVFSNSNIKLIGNESQTVGPFESPMNVHLILLKKDIVLLEGVVLKDVENGKYLLCAQPLNFKGIEGAPCRAILLK